MASALNRFIKTIKDTDKAAQSPSATLKKIIEDYTLTHEFDDYIVKHAADIPKYLASNEAKRKGLFRASSAGKCVQQQGFALMVKTINDALPSAAKKYLAEHAELVDSTEPPRPARQHRALHNGTFAHVRWHLLFDALHEKGTVRTIAAEELGYEATLKLSGTIDRVIEFDFGGKVVRAIVDYKTIKSEYFDRLVAPQDDHILQQHAYGLFDYNADMLIMLYENKNTHELKIYDRVYDTATFAELRKTYKEVAKWAHTTLLGGQPEKPLPIITNWCMYCPYSEPCAKLHPERVSKAK